MKVVQVGILILKYPFFLRIHFIDHANRLQPTTTTTLLTDSEDDEDPFGMNTGPKFDVFSTTKPVYLLIEYNKIYYLIYLDGR